MSVDIEPKAVKPYSIRYLEANKGYLKRLMVGYLNGEPTASLQDIARKSGYSPRKGRILAMVERVKETAQVEGPLNVLDILGMDFVPLSPEEIEKIDQIILQPPRLLPNLHHPVIDV